MEQKSVGKLCQRNERGRHDAPGAARPRFRLHLRASACICLYLGGAFSPDGRCSELLFCFILLHVLGAC